MKEVCILDPEAIQARLLRLAYEILEQNHELDQFIFIGIDERGYLLAQALGEKLKQISSRSVWLLSMREIPQLESSYLHDQLSNRILFLVDDVLYTGRTLLQALAQIIAYKPAAVRSVILIDRGHRQWPVAADFVGLELATTLQEFVSVRCDPTNRMFAAYLS